LREQKVPRKAKLMRDPSDQKPDSASVYMVIRGHSGKYISPFVSGSLASEKEVLFPPGVRFRVSSMRKMEEGRLYILELEEAGTGN
jgi:hypothetical protein